MARTVTNGDSVEIVYQSELPVQRLAQRMR